MCLAIPMKVLEVNGALGLVEVGGVKRKVDLSLVGEVHAGQYVVVHAGFALSVTDEDDAKKTIALFEEMAAKVAQEDAENNRL